MRVLKIIIFIYWVYFVNMPGILLCSFLL